MAILHLFNKFVNLRQYVYHLYLFVGNIQIKRLLININVYEGGGISSLCTHLSKTTLLPIKLMIQGKHLIFISPVLIREKGHLFEIKNAQQFVY